MSIYDILRPGWNKGFVILIGLNSSALIATPPAHEHHSSDWREHTADNSYIHHTVSRDEEMYGDSQADIRRRHDNNSTRHHVRTDDEDDDDCDECDSE